VREIKFRVILKSSDGLLSVEYYNLQNISNIYQQSVFQVVSVVLYTGIKDKHGKEIYEGDILKWEMDEEIDVVVWHEKELCYGTQRKLYYCNCGDLSIAVEVIGNIYENSELTDSKEVKCSNKGRE